MNLYSGGSAAERSWSRAEAVRSPALWLLVSSAFLAAIGTGGVAFHTASYFTDARIAPTIAAGAVSLMALSGAFGNGLWGALAERLHPRRLSVAMMVVSAAAVAVLILMDKDRTSY